MGQYRDAGKKLKAKGRPIGQTLGHTFGDAPTFTYPLMWSFGGSEVDKSGKVAVNSKETIESVKFMTGVLEGRAAMKAVSPGTTPTTIAPSSPRPSRQP